MKTIKYFVMAFAAVAMLASCAQNDEGGKINNDGKKSVTIKIANMAAPATRATLDDGITSSTNVKVIESDDLTAIFYTSSNALIMENGVALTRSLDVSAVNDPDVVSGEFVFHLLPRTVGKIVITNMNVTEATAYLTANTPPDPANWNPAGGDVQATPVCGVAVIDNSEPLRTELHGGDTYNVYGTVDNEPIDVDALLARFEISGIVVGDAGANARFATLDLGAFGFVYGETEDQWKDNETVTTPYAYPSWRKDVLTANPVAADAFAYNVLPDTVPTFVLQVDGATDGAYAGLAGSIDWPWYVKTKTLYNGDIATGTALTGADIDAGKIYQIKYNFSCDDIKAWDGESAFVCVDVTINIANWVVVPVVTPDFN